MTATATYVLSIRGLALCHMAYSLSCREQQIYNKNGSHIDLEITVLSRASTHGRLHLKRQKLRVGSYTENLGWAPARDNTVVIMGLQQMYLVY